MDEVEDDDAGRASADPAACAEWAATGRCRRWGCTMRHDVEAAKAATAAAAARRDAMRQRMARMAIVAPVSSHADGELVPATAASLRARVQHSREQRAAVFAAWLVRTFSAERLRAGAGVLDVAGGRGDVAFALAVDHNVPATLVDPKLRTLAPSQLERLKGAAAPPQITSLFSTEWLTPGAEAAASLQASSALVGLHPDQATDAIADVALALGKPFAILPCCVYQQEFPDRRRPDGAPVETYADLVAYLLAKDPAVRTATLDFFGRNVVVYWDPAG